MKINLGAGYSKYEGYLTVDNDPRTSPDFLVDLEAGNLPFTDNSIEEILAFHVLEHIGTGFFPLIQEIYRVCKDGALVFIKVPYYRSDLFSGDCGHVRTITGHQFNQFSKKNNHNSIKNNEGNSHYALQLNVDFEKVESTCMAFPEWEEKFKTMSTVDIQFATLHYWNVFYEEHILLKVIK
jgi:hypothetical protein